MPLGGFTITQTLVSSTVVAKTIIIH